MASFSRQQQQQQPDAKRIEEMNSSRPAQPANKSPPSSAPSTVEGLPAHFVDSLRVLFDILDENKRGLVRLADIESRWSGTGVQDLPQGVLDSLAKVTPVSGMLSFERFCAGLKIALLRSSHSTARRDVDKLWQQKVAGNPPPPLRRGASQPEMKGNGHPAHQGGERPMRAWESETRPRTVAAVAAGSQVKRERRGDPRRHTVTNGIDYGLLKRMKQLEGEKDLLVQGLEAVERARQWYHRRMAGLQDRQSSLGKPPAAGKMADAVGSPEAHQQRLDYQRSRVSEANRQLQLLIDSSNFPASHINLAVAAPANGPAQAGAKVKSGSEMTITALRDQNRLLTVEVSQKSDKVTQLEKEKAALIRELFQARARGHKDLNGTFM